jgi:hypothetical protein
MKGWIVATSSMLLLAGCGGSAASDNAQGAAGNAAEAATNRAEAKASAPAPGAANVAIGRWVQDAGNCDEMADVEFTATSVRMFGAPDGSSMDIPITYSEATATGVIMQSEPGQPKIVATVRDPTHIVLTSPERSERNCTLVRR